MLSSKQHGQSVLPTAGAPARSLLLVDDESTLRSALRRFFMRRGWRVSEAEDGEHARAMLLDADESCREHFDVVITDLRMPRLSGIELHTLVAQVDTALASRFIFSSGDTTDDDAMAFISRTSCPVIPKPFELAALLALAEKIVADAGPVAR